MTRVIAAAFMSTESRACLTSSTCTPARTVVSARAWACLDSSTKRSTSSTSTASPRWTRRRVSRRERISTSAL